MITEAKKPVETSGSESLAAPCSAILPTLRKNIAYALYAYDRNGTKVLFYYPFINTVHRSLPFKMNFRKPGEKDTSSFHYKGKSDKEGLTFDYLEV